ncbi:hypothetical protein SYNPS1DRAFT_27789 [Syncephalis pseudoplumigaleata]|uniref:Uncharacterized protein n=1 Tax=Syncephalis pseudoplumigaleata TaxID=1712513 RepID=A0A4P9Z202_9FUNG|nr:hypothetical protein SYNPS1DRAFT_27789 [Syncephalis pseudoplumigaleata]|eukprot:RKP26523.1 hypothetical protein SYNPS1DRAFT_27789 [Syncephalis pseudoplumigaleata]
MGMPQSNIDEKKAASTSSEPLSLLERRLSGRTGASGVTFVDKRIEVTRGLALPNARAPRTPYPDTVPFTPVSGNPVPRTPGEGILDQAGAVLNTAIANDNKTNGTLPSVHPSSTASVAPASHATSNGATGTTTTTTTSAAAAAALNKRRSTTARFAWMSDLRRIIGVTTIAAVMLAMIATSAWPYE